MSMLPAIVVPLAQQLPAPEDVKAGWVAFGIFLLLVAAVVFLALSLRKQLGKVNFEEKEPGPKQQEGRAPEDGRDDRA